MTRDKAEGRRQKAEVNLRHYLRIIYAKATMINEKLRRSKKATVDDRARGLLRERRERVKLIVANNH